MPETTQNNVAQINKGQMRGLFVNDTFDREKRTIDVVFATETLDVERYDWRNQTSFKEQLVLDETACKLARLNAGAPVLDNHNRYGSVLDKLGVVARAWIENNKGVATLKFKRSAEADQLLNDIEDGITNTVSVGYSINTYERQPVVDGETPIYRAIDWEPYEISFPIIPADIEAKVRGAEGDKKDIKDCTLIIRNNEQQLNTKPMPDTKEEGQRGAGAPTPENVDINKVQSEAVTAERKRIKDINDAVRKAGLKPEFATQHVDGGRSIDTVREAIIDELAKEDSEHVIRAASNHITVGKQDSEKKREAMENALLHRTNPDKFKLEDGNREYRNMNLLRMAEEALIIDGVNTRGMSQREIARTALGIGETRSMSTSDFPHILGNTVNRVLRKAYEEAEPTFKPFTRATTNPDFKTKAVLSLSGIVDSFDEVKEGAEYKASKMDESKEEYKLAKFGRMINITWETIINDDLGAFNRIPVAIANKARQKQSDIVWRILINNPNMADGTALFHTDHANLAGTGAAINVSTLNEGRKAIRTQKGPHGDFLNLTPAFLIVGPNYESLAYQYTSANYVATKNSDINPKYHQDLKPIVEPRITGNNWFMSANPNMIDTIEYAFLEGEGELFTETQRGFEVDGMQIKARMVFAAKAIDHRGLFKNVGA